MILLQYQKDVKLEALTRRAPKALLVQKREKISCCLNLLPLYIFPFIMIMNPIKVFCWNCRGISNPNTLDRIKALMNHLNPDIFCLVELWRTLIEYNIFVIGSKLSGNEPGSQPLVSQGGSSFSGLCPWVKSLQLLFLGWHFIWLFQLEKNTWILSTLYNSQVISKHKALWKLPLV